MTRASLLRVCFSQFLSVRNAAIGDATVRLGWTGALNSILPQGRYEASGSRAQSSLRMGHANLLVELVLDVNDVHLHVLEHVRQSCSYA